MYSDGLLTGTALPEGTVRLTFDDGPGTTDGKGVGPRTPDLAQFLEWPKRIFDVVQKAYLDTDLYRGAEKDRPKDDAPPSK